MNAYEKVIEALMVEQIKEADVIKRIRKSTLYSRIRQYFPMPDHIAVNDHDQLDEAEVVKIDWPASIKKPTIGVVQDYRKYPRWSKFCRFLGNNSFCYEIYDIHAHDWIEKAKKLDVIIGIASNSLFDLQETRSKYYILETFLGKKCYPSLTHALLYEDKCLEAYISQAIGIPFAQTYISYDKADALSLLHQLKYPFVSKIVPSSGSQGVELVQTIEQGRKIIQDAFSRNGRKTNVIYARQKNYVYFQDFIPNDGYDIRVIVVGNWLFGYYRKVLKGDFRASGMNQKEKGELPEEAMNIALKVNKIINSPLLAVDMLRDPDGKYYIIEFSPFYLMGYSDELRVNGIPGVYISEGGSYSFKEGRYWVAELALREFLLNHYLPDIQERKVMK